MKNSIKVKKIIILLGDIAVLFSSLYLALVIRYGQKPSNDLWLEHLWSFSVIFIGWIIILYIVGLYDLHLAINNTKFLKLVSKSTIFAVLGSSLFFYLNPTINISPKTNLALFIIVFLILFFVWRRIFNWIIQNQLPKNYIAIVGFNEQSKEIIKELQAKPQLGYSVALVISNETSEEEINGIPIIKEFNNLHELIQEKKITTIVLTSYPHRSPELRDALFKCLRSKINYISLSNFYENITGKISIDTINQMWFLENLNEGDKSWFNLIKRFYDIAFSLLFLIITIIFWPLISLIIKLESKGEIFFKQSRAGQNNIPFTMIKFRTMTKSNNDLSPTTKNDARITRFGNFMRKTRIDEIPQILNILKGEMSFVGPRPERPEIVQDLEKKIPFYQERTLAKPGVTGWDQISGEYHSPSLADSLKKLQYDLFYVKNRSIYLDLSIIMKTIYTVLSREGR